MIKIEYKNPKISQPCTFKKFRKNFSLNEDISIPVESSNDLLTPLLYNENTINKNQNVQEMVEGDHIFPIEKAQKFYPITFFSKTLAKPLPL
ncbi:MAG: hypothetical protein IKV85_05650 [Ruminococcus sp.]|nr:hypothetical protein [Ruminococcus sp.]